MLRGQNKRWSVIDLLIEGSIVEYDSCPDQWNSQIDNPKVLFVPEL